jgi:hypothetical protein
VDDPAVIRAEIGALREELGETLDAVGAKVNASRRALGSRAARGILIGVAVGVVIALLTRRGGRRR